MALGYAFRVSVKNDSGTVIKQSDVIKLSKKDYSAVVQIILNTYGTRTVFNNIQDSDGPFVITPQALDLIRKAIEGTPLPPPVITPTSTPAPVPTNTQNVIFSIKAEDGTFLTDQVLEPFDYNFISTTVPNFGGSTTELSRQIVPVTNFTSFYVAFAASHRSSIPAPPTLPGIPSTVTGQPEIKQVTQPQGQNIIISTDLGDQIVKAQSLTKTAGFDPLNLISGMDKKIKEFLISALPKTPDQAVDAAINVTIASASLLAVGESTALAIEALYPTKHLGVTEIVEKALTYLGIGSISASLYSIIINSGFSKQLQYYFNYNLQPRKVDVSTITKALHYGKAKPEDVSTALRFEGYNESAIQKYIETIYEPLNVRMIAKLIELEVFDNEFFIEQLSRDGLDPAVIPKIITGFQTLELKPFKQQVITIVYQQYKQGWANRSDALNILEVFGIAHNLRKWIIKVADLEYEIEGRRNLDKIINEEFNQNVIDAKIAIDLKVQNGMDRRRATQEIKLLTLKNFPKLDKTQRGIFIDEFNKLFTTSQIGFVG